MSGKVKGEGKFGPVLN